VDLPPHPDIVVTGAVAESDKWDIMRDALVSVSPSALESFSLVVIEAWVEQLPVLVNGSRGPTGSIAKRSGGGLWFTSYPEFDAVLERLVSDDGLRAELGGRGRAFVDGTSGGRCSWRAYGEFLTTGWPGEGHARAVLNAQTERHPD